MFVKIVNVNVKIFIYKFDMVGLAAALVEKEVIFFNMR